jgi:dTDP-4-amino-4,6-dideoxygalactose transaminase
MTSVRAPLTIPLLDLRAQYRSIKPEIDTAIQQVLDRGQFILGPEVEVLEREVAAYCGTRHAIGVASGTDALELALRACGIGPGDEVITTAYSFFATAEAIVAVGAIPVFVDIELATYNIDPDQVAAAVTPKTKALLPVHLYGHPYAVDALQAIAHRHGLKVIEDCAQAIGAEYQGRRAGAFGDAGALSFFPTKNLGGYGDGGMVVTNYQATADQVRLLRVHGSKEKYWHLMMGRNSRLDELQAAILRVKLRHLDAWNSARRANAERYRAAFAKSGALVETPKELPGYQHVYHQFCVRSTRRDEVKARLTSAGIGCQVYYPSTLPAQPALSALGLQGKAFAHADSAVKELLALPMFPELSLEQITRIAQLAAAS